MEALSQKIPFIDLEAQKQRLGKRINDAIDRVLSHGQFIMGPEIKELEIKLAGFTGSKHVVTCSSGTDALAMVLMAKGIGAGDAVICPSFTFCATAEVVAWLGATPVFADVLEDTFNIDPESIEAAIVRARDVGLHVKGIIPVDLFGQPAAYDAILPIAAREGLFVLCDAAQAFGAEYHGRRIGSVGDATTTSFFPAKPLGCYGDGGAIFTDDDALAGVLRSIRVHGQGSDKYDNVRIGMAGRLDTIQAAVLIEKLTIFEEEIQSRNLAAQRYEDMLGRHVSVPRVLKHCRSVWAQYTLKVAAERRQSVVASLAHVGVPTQVYYPRPLHLQTAYGQFPRAAERLPVSETLSASVLSIPMHPYLSHATQTLITSAFRNALA